VEYIKRIIKCMEQMPTDKDLFLYITMYFNKKNLMKSTMKNINIIMEKIQCTSHINILMNVNKKNLM